MRLPTCKVLLVAALILLFPSGPLWAGQGSELIGLVLPAGDPEAGKVAFSEHHCFSCHKVSGDPDFNTLPPLVQGPDLGPSVRKEPGYLATAIVAPSHAVSKDHEAYSDNEGYSLMPDFNEVLTVRELIDLLAYLRSSEVTP